MAQRDPARRHRATAILGWALIVLAVLGAAELLGGYLLYRHLPGSGLAILHALGLDRSTDAAPPPAPAGDETLDLTAEPNPFFRDVPDGVLVLYHPFLDYVGVYSDEPTAAGTRFFHTDNDYFGFRNPDSRLYFAPDDGFLIVLTGGSEAAGYSHPVTIAAYLEDDLNDSGGIDGCPVRVLNLSMNSYVLANEIQSFVHLAYALRPDVVISHSGWNDLIYGVIAPGPFKVLGLNYFGPMVDWPNNLYGRPKPQSFRFAVHESQNDRLPEVFFAMIDKYRDIVTANGAYFLPGLQGYRTALEATGTPMDEVHARVHAYYADLKRGAARIPGYADFTGRADIGFVDTVHSTPDSAPLIARTYAARIRAGTADGTIRLNPHRVHCR